MASKQASDDLSTVRENLEDIIKLKENESLARVDEMKKSMKEIDVTLECLKSKQNNCDNLAKANRSWLTEMSDDFGNQFQELKEQGFNNARDRQNIKEQINQMQTRIDEENHLTRANLEVHSFQYFSLLTFSSLLYFTRLDEYYDHNVRYKLQKKVKYLLSKWSESSIPSCRTFGGCWRKMLKSAQRSCKELVTTKLPATKRTKILRRR